jgi:hypothetical protein
MSGGGMNSARVLAAFALAVVAQGCGGGPALWPVSGVVTYTDGTPLTNGVIEFAPTDGGPGARASLGKDGRFTLRTGDREGAVAAKHQLAVVLLLPADSAPLATKHKHRYRLPHARYRRFDTSGLERVVEAGKPNEFRIEIEPARD